MILTLDDYFGEHSSDVPSKEVRDNALDLLARVNALLSKIDLPCAKTAKVNSGWRPVWFNATVPNASPTSKHITGQAIDLADPDGDLDEFLLFHQNRLADHGLYLEHPSSTRRWTHLQSVPPRSGAVVFYP